MKRITAVFLLLLSLFLVGCGADISAYQDREILVVGLAEEDFSVTPRQLSEMKCTSETATGQSAKAGTVTAYGPTLDTFLAHYGRDKSEFKCIRFTAEDGYDVVLGPVTWEKRTVILSIANGSKPLDAYQQPMRVVIPGGSSGNRVRMVTKIEFVPLESGQ